MQFRWVFLWLSISVSFQVSAQLEFDLSTIYRLWAGESQPQNVDSETLERFKAAVNRTIERTKFAMKEAYGVNGLEDRSVSIDNHVKSSKHRISKREIPHNLIRDHLGIQILQGLNSIFKDAPVPVEILYLDLIYCADRLLLARVLSNRKMDLIDFSNMEFRNFDVPIGPIQITCSKDNLLVVVGSETTERSLAFKICFNCGDPLVPFFSRSQIISPKEVLAIHQLTVEGKSPKFAFCSEKLVTIITWERDYFHAPILIPTNDCISVEFVSIHSIDYLIVAENGNLEIYRIEPMSYDHVQSMTVGNATSIKSFSIGSGISKSFYLVITNHDEYNPQKTKPVIAKWHGDIYLVQQCLNVVEVTGVFAISESNKIIIVVTSATQGTVFFQFNGFKFVETFQYSTSVLSLPTTVAFAHSPNGTIYLTATDSVFNEVFKADFFTKNELADWHQSALIACEKLKDRVSAADLEALVKQVNDSFFVNQTDPIVIGGNITFDNFKVEDTLVTNEVNIIRENLTYSHRILDTLKELSEKLDKAKGKLKKVQELLGRALKTSGNQTVVAEYNFETVECVNCHINKVNTELLNGNNVTDLDSQVVYIDVAQTVKDLVFEDELTVNSMRVEQINGVNASDFLFNNTNAIITGKKIFANNVSAGNLIVNGLANGVNISSDNLLLDYGDQKVTGNLNFEATISVENLQVTGAADGVNLDDFYQRTARVNQNTTITGQPIFKHLKLRKDLNITEGKLVDGVDIFNLNRKAFRVDANQTIIAPFSFNNVIFQNGLDGNVTINGIRIPEDVVRIDEDATLDHKVTFHKAIHVEELHVNSSINGIGIVEDEDFPKQLDILISNEEQTITGRKSFTGDIHIGADSDVTGFIDQIDLSEFSQVVVRKNSTQIIPGKLVVNGSVTFKEPVTVGNTVDDVNITRIFDHGVLLNSTVLPNFNRLVFESVVEANNVQCEDINGVDTLTDLLFRNSDAGIGGLKSFTDGIVIDGESKIDGLVNNVNLSFFDDVLYKQGNQTISANKTFVNTNVTFDKAVVNGTVDTKRVPEDLIPLDSLSDIKVVTKVIFNVVISNEITLNLIKVYGTIDGVDINVLANDTLTYSEPQNVTGTKYIQGGIIAAEGSNLKIEGTVNGINFTETYEDAVFIHDDQEIGGNKTFLETVTFSKLNFTGSFDNVSAWEYENNWLLQGENQTVFANLNFGESVKLNENLEVGGLINNVNVTDLFDTTVKINENSTVKGPVFIENAFSEGNITLLGMVNGKKFGRDLVLVNRDEVITGAKTFNNVVIKGNLASPIVDGVDIDDICRKALLTDLDQHIDGTLTVNGTIYLEKDLMVGGLINDINIAEFNNKVVKTSGNNTIKNYLNVTNLIINAPVFVNGTIDGVNFDKLSNTYLSKTISQNITGQYNFTKPVEIETLVTDSVTVADGNVNQINIVELNNTVLKNNGDQVVNATYKFTKGVNFEDDLDVNGEIDGIKIPEEVVIIGKNNTITGQKTFNNLKIMNNLDMGDGNEIQTVDISEWERSAVFANNTPNDTSTYIVRGEKIFKNGITLGEASVENLNDQAINNETVLLTFGNQTILGAKTFATDVTLPDISVNHINGANITEIDENAVKSDRTNIIEGSFTFTAKQNFSNIVVEQFVDDVNITDLYSTLHETANLTNLEKKFQRDDLILTDIKMAVNHQAVLLNYYVKVKDLEDSSGILGQGDFIFSLNKTKSPPDCSTLTEALQTNLTFSYPNILAIDSSDLGGTSRTVIAFDSQVSSYCPGVIDPAAPVPLNESDVAFVHLLDLDSDQPRILASFGLDFVPNKVKILFLDNYQVIVASDWRGFEVFTLNENLARTSILRRTYQRNIMAADFYGKGDLLFAALNLGGAGSFKTVIFFFNVVSETFEMQKTDCYFQTSALHFVEFDDLLFLVIAKKPTYEGLGGLLVFKIKENIVEKFQVIYKAAGSHIFPVDVNSFKIEDQQMYMFVLSEKPTDNILILKYEGSQGFNLYSTLTSKKGVKLTVFKDYLAVTSLEKTTALFKAKLRGKRFNFDY